MIEDRSHAFLQELLATPSPSGYESPVQGVVRSYLGDFADEVTTDVHGNVIACKNPGAPLRVMFDGHCDQIGLVVSHIDDDGFLYSQTVGFCPTDPTGFVFWPFQVIQVGGL